MRYGLALPSGIPGVFGMFHREHGGRRQQNQQRRGTVHGAATAAAGFMRALSIRSFDLVTKRHEAALLAVEPALSAVRCSLFRERGIGKHPTIVIGGFVPDATEAVEFQRPILRKYGSIYYLNFPKNGFSTAILHAQIDDIIAYLAQKRQRPTLLGISFGCGLVVDFLKQANEVTHSRIKGLLMISPVLGVDDLVRGVDDRQQGMRMLEHNLTKILDADPADERQLERQIERGRRCFQSLFEAGAGSRSLSMRHLSIRKQIFGVLADTTYTGGYQRVLALRNLVSLKQFQTVFAGPTQIMLAEAECDILAPKSPTLALFGSHALTASHFPDARVCTVRSKVEGDPVAHASLIFHEQYFNPRIASWFERLHGQPLFAMVG